MRVAFWAAAVALFRFSLSAGAYQARKRFNCSGRVPLYPFYIRECTLRHVFRFCTDECTLRRFYTDECAYAGFRYPVLYRWVHVMSCIPVQYKGMHFMSCIPVQYKGMHFTSCISVQYRWIHFTSCIPVQYTGMHWLYAMYSDSIYIERERGMHFTSYIAVLYMDLVLYRL